jgi:hypothetical protein
MSFQIQQELPPPIRNVEYFSARTTISKQSVIENRPRIDRVQQDGRWACCSQQFLGGSTPFGVPTHLFIDNLSGNLRQSFGQSSTERKSVDPPEQNVEPPERNRNNEKVRF